jgi:hypothetical protein
MTDVGGSEISFSAIRSREPVCMFCVSMTCSGCCVRVLCRRRRQRSVAIRVRRTKATAPRAMPTLAPTESPLDLEVSDVTSVGGDVDIGVIVWVDTTVGREETVSCMLIIVVGLETDPVLVGAAPESRTCVIDEISKGTVGVTSPEG